MQKQINIFNIKIHFSAKMKGEKMSLLFIKYIYKHHTLLTHPSHITCFKQMSIRSGGWPLTIVLVFFKKENILDLCLFCRLNCSMGRLAPVALVRLQTYYLLWTQFILHVHVCRLICYLLQYETITF